MEKVIITGGSDGLGYELSKQLLEKGVGVVCLSRSKPKNLTCDHIPVDLTDQAELTNAIEAVKTSYSDFDALINNAGKFALESLNALTYEVTNQTIQLNLIAPMLLTSGLLDLVKKNEADIALITSKVSYKANLDEAAYGASKWGLRGFAENLRLELASTHCRVTTIAPGGFQSRFFEKFKGEHIDLSPFMDLRGIARLIIQTLEAPKDIEVSEMILSRKKK